MPSYHGGPYPDQVNMGYETSVLWPREWLEHPSWRGFEKQDWRDVAPLSYRSGKHCPRKHRPESDVVLKAKNPEIVADFVNYNCIDSRVGGYGRCLCQIVLVTGAECVEHLRCDDAGKRPKDAKEHWAWYVEVAPRGRICPMVIARCRAAMGSETPKRIACDILIHPSSSDGEAQDGNGCSWDPESTKQDWTSNIMCPTSEWVLGHRGGGTWAKGDLPKEMTVKPGTKCPRCRAPNSYTEFNERTHQFWQDQNHKTAHVQGLVHPYEYRPPSGVGPHPYFEPGSFYHANDIERIPARVSTDHFRHARTGNTLTQDFPTDPPASTAEQQNLELNLALNASA